MPRHRGLLPARLRVACVLVGIAAAAPAAAAADVSGLAPGERAKRLEADAALIGRLRAGLAGAVAFARSRPDLFPAERPRAPRVPTAAEREEILSTWKAVLERTLALDSLGRFYEPFWRLGAEARGDAWALEFAAFCARYRFALEFISVVERDQGLDALLNEPVPELGLPSGTYDRYCLTFLNVTAAARFGALAAAGRLLAAGGRAGALAAGAEEDAAAILRFGRGEGLRLTADNAIEVVAETAYGAWFPVQAGVSEWMGDTKVLRRGEALISQEQIRELAHLLRPGDILLERREWYLSNIGLPGFWPHAALYVGTPEERRRHLGGREVEDWARARGSADGDLEALLAASGPGAYRDSLEPREEGHPPRVLEAMSEGVVFTSLEHSAAADSLAVLRPRLEPVEIAAALVRAFGYAGRPYDFDFDFRTDAALVCTELVFKAFEPGPGSRGLRLPLVEVLGRPVTPANEIVRQLDRDWGTPEQQLELVLFLDGSERDRVARPAGREEFRASWRRPKWHILTAGPAP